MEESTAEAGVAVENNPLSNHSLGNTLILKVTMPDGLLALREGCHFLALSVNTCCQAQ